ncbi:MAG TPA: MFS transporter [Actinobacteria bacterium]|nr:MFS transporter [Actinomycetota bacterium]
MITRLRMLPSGRARLRVLSCDMAPPEASSRRSGWIVPLSATVMVGFGVILYGFSVYVTDHAAGAEFSKTVLSVAYGGSVFVGGLLALPVGRYADRHGVRAVVGAGALLGSLGLIVFSISNQAWQVVAAWWVLIGPAQAMIYYEPAYVAINQLSPVRDRARVLATVTLIGGLAGIVFIPLAQRLVTLLGWRSAVLVLALVLLIVGEATALFALPRRSRTLAGAAMASEVGISISGLFRDRRFVLYTVAMAVTFMAAQGVIAHRLTRFEEVGFSLATVALWAAIASAMSLPGRWIAPILAARFGATRVQAGITLIVALGVSLMVNGTQWWQMVGHFSLFGLAFGGLLPLRAMVMTDWYSGPTYGRIMGTQWTIAVLIGATGPALVGILRDATGDYQASIVLLTVLLLVGMVTIVAAGRARPGVASAHGRVS